MKRTHPDTLLHGRTRWGGLGAAEAVSKSVEILELLEIINFRNDSLIHEIVSHKTKTNCSRTKDMYTIAVKCTLAMAFASVPM